MGIFGKISSKPPKDTWSLAEQVALLHNSPLLDPVWYRQYHQDLRDKPIDVARHYLEHGAAEGRNPHPLFDSRFYLEQNPDVLEAGANPLVHFLLSGAADGRSPHPLFDSRFYLRGHPEAAEQGSNPLVHFLLLASNEIRNPHPLFDAKFYLKRNPEVVASVLKPLVHYVLYGGNERRDPHPLFATKFYLNQLSDADPGMNPLVHYILHGWKQGLDPHPLFDIDWYLKQNSDVARAALEPLSHYILHGSAEGRFPNRLFDPSWYRSEYPDVANAGIEPLVHYYQIGHKERRRTSPHFDPSWYLSRNPAVVASGIEPLAHFLSTGSSNDKGLDEYTDWIREYDTISFGDREAMSKSIDAMDNPPLVSVVMPVYETPEVYLRAAIESVIGQLYPYWELCIADDASKGTHVRRVLEEYRVLDSRIKVCYRGENGHISAATNSAFALAQGRFVALLDHDDVLREHALYMLAAVLTDYPDVDMIYSDEDRIDTAGRRQNPYFKSDWNPDLMLAQNMFCHLGVYRKSIVDELGGFRCDYDGSQDYDLVLRAQHLTRPERIRHIPHVLYHWRAIPGSTALSSEAAKPYALIRARQAIADVLSRSGVAAEVLASPHSAFSRVRYKIADPAPLVTIIVPSIDQLDFLPRCLEGLLVRTDYDNYEVLIVGDPSRIPRGAHFDVIGGDPRFRFISYEGSPNLPESCNFAATHAAGSLLCVLNCFVEALDRDWLTEMVSQALRPEVGAVGALLYFPDGRIKHAGIAVSSVAIAQYPHRGLRRGKRGDYGYFGRAALVQDLSAVSADCLVMRRAVFEELGGLNGKDLANAYSDIDLCLRIREAGYRIVWTPYAELCSHAPATYNFGNKAKASQEETRYMSRRWGRSLARDPYHSGNLTLSGSGFSMAFPPRTIFPWRGTDTERGNLLASSIEGRLVAASGLFNPMWYLAQNPDVLAAGADPLEHYLGNGSAEGRRPNPIFDPAWYRRQYPDVSSAGWEPLTHYVITGSAEGRCPSPVFDPAKYRELHPDAAAAQLDPLAHCLLTTSASFGLKTPEVSGRLTELPHLPIPDFFELRGFTPRGTIAVVLHLYYPDLWDEMRTAIQRIAHPFDLFVSLVKETSGDIKSAIKHDFPDAHVFEFEQNRGRDIVPFLALLQTGALFGYELVCKLHSKRSSYVPDGDAWRRELIDGILGSQSQIDRIVASFRSDPDLGIVVADGNIFSGEDRWSGNENMLGELLPRIGISSNVKDQRFPGGSIFWIRPLLLRTLAGARIDLSDFELEPLPWNGALPHAVERMFGLICEDAGMRFAEWSEIREAGLTVRSDESKVHLFAYYLPQFHPIPENDKWWGKGFTEWTNITRAKPLFSGHRQPRLPSDLGFCDLRLPETRDAQASLAREYGLSGFCYYYYWFNGRRLLERPLDEVFESGKPDFPFLICWANEPWSRNWDGMNESVLLPQTYEEGWERAFARDVAPLLRDQRYFRLQGRPMLCIYRIRHIPRVVSAMRALRAALVDEGVPEVHLGAGWLQFERDEPTPVDPSELGLDSYFEFPPHRIPAHLLQPRPADLAENQLRALYDYNRTVTSAITKLDEPVVGRRHRGVMAAFDNTSRRGGEASVFQGATPTNFRRWLRSTILHERRLPDERVVFINAWNEWAEGACLEPDRDFGKGWLEAVSSALGT